MIILKYLTALVRAYDCSSYLQLTSANFVEVSKIGHGDPLRKIVQIAPVLKYTEKVYNLSREGLTSLRLCEYVSPIAYCVGVWFLTD